MALGLCSSSLHACTHGCWSADCLIYLEFAHALVKNNSNIYPIYVDGDQVLAFVAQHLVDEQGDRAAADDAAIINGSPFDAELPQPTISAT